MAGVNKIKGIDQVLQNLNREINSIKDRTMKGLIRATVIVRRGMDKKIPVNLNNLRASLFTTTAKSEKGFGSLTKASFKGDDAAKLAENHQKVIGDTKGRLEASKRLAISIGFTAYYAWYVHEMVGATFQRPTAQAKFLESTLKEKQNDILAVINKEATIKGKKGKR